MSNLTRWFARKYQGGFLRPRAPHPSPAACLALINHDGTNWRVLMGRRSAHHVFMPGVYVFPGGRVDTSDGFVSLASRFSPKARRVLEKTLTPRHARATAVAAIRETWEETGWALVKKDSGLSQASSPDGSFFHARGFLPDIKPLQVFARAITPAGKARRFDTWFFYAEKQYAQYFSDFTPSGELEDLNWRCFETIRKLSLAPVTSRVLDRLEHRLARTGTRR